MLTLFEKHKKKVLKYSSGLFYKFKGTLLILNVNCKTRFIYDIYYLIIKHNVRLLRAIILYTSQ